MRQALAAGVVTALVCAVMSFFVYLRRLPHATSGIAHGAFGGVALGLLLGWGPLPAAMTTALALAGLVGYLSRRGGVAHDSTTGILSTTAMAAGVIAVGLRRGYVPDLAGFMFGSLLTSRPGDLRLMVVAGTVIVVATAVTFRQLLLIAFDPPAAEAAGLPVAFFDYLLLAMIAVAVVLAVRLLGVILAGTMMIAPAATGYQLARGYRGMLAWGIVVGVGTTVAGLATAFYLDLPPGATITLWAAMCFALACGIAPARGALRQWLGRIIAYLGRLSAKGQRYS